MLEASQESGKPRISPLELLVLLVTLLFPINYSLMLKLRPVDFLLMMLIVAALPAMRTRPNAPFLLSILFFLVYVASTAYGIFVLGIVSPTNFLFIYKYVMLFALFWVLCSIRLHPVRLERLHAAMNAVFYFLVVYVFLYVFLWARGVISGSIRVTFPLTNDVNPEFGTISDSPLYSVVLSTTMIGYLFFPGKGDAREMIRKLVVGGLSIAAILLSGSRTGFISLPITFGIWLVRKAFHDLFSGRVRLRAGTIAILVLALALLVVAVVQFRQAEESVVGKLVSRIFSVDVLKEVGIENRVFKTLYVLRTILLEGPVLIGIGMQSTSHTWIDMGYAAVILATGTLGLALLLAIIVMFLRGMHAEARTNGALRYYRGLEYLFINYCVCAITSEYFLVTRGMVPFAVFAAVYVHSIRNAGATRGMIAGTAIAAA